METLFPQSHETSSIGITDNEEAVRNSNELPLPSTLYNYCFTCNSKGKKISRIGRKKNTESEIPSSNPIDIVQLISSLWKLSPEVLQDKEGKIRYSCRNCLNQYKMLNRILIQLESLQKDLKKVKEDIESKIGQTIHQSLGYKNGISINNYDEPEQMFRLRFLQLNESSEETTQPLNHYYCPSSGGLVNGQEFWRNGVDNLTTSLEYETINLQDQFLNNYETEESIIANTSVVHPQLNLINYNIADSGEQCVEKGDDNINQGPSSPFPASPTDNDGSSIQKSMEESTEKDELIWAFKTSQFDTECEDLQEKRIKCHKCRYTFKDEIGLAGHLKKCHEGKDYPYHCEVCFKHFKARRQLDVHILGHKGETPFICEHCGLGFKSEQLLNFHIKNKHVQGGREFKCSECSREFITKSKLKMHKIIHNRIYPVRCPVCDKGFTGNGPLNLHMVKHNDTNPWKCLDCDKTYLSSKALVNHRSQTHAKKFKYPCPNCPSGAPSRSALARHLLSHRDEKNFECNICGNKFKFDRNLRKHLKVHANDKNFQCSLCTKTFIDKYKLVRHTRIHEGNRPFSCELCGKAFYTKDCLAGHAKHHARKAAKRLETKSKTNAARKKVKNPSKPSSQSSTECLNSSTTTNISNNTNSTCTSSIQNTTSPQESQDIPVSELVPTFVCLSSPSQEEVILEDFASEIFSGELYHFNISYPDL